ncbi:MAG: PAS domain-containing protein, partial [Thermoplasmata archaeon]|nr:PAS domain-containing protein [Thermoplasmata archaeon]NIY01989.1 PAS domain-containing protein [Thermoplasmata archaeon]
MVKEKASPAGSPILLQGIIASRNPVILTDLGGKVTFANPACEHLLGYQRGELLGEHLSVL